MENSYDVVIVGAGPAGMAAAIYAIRANMKVLMLDRLSPYALGTLVALYEHVVLAQGVVWGLNSFDQWGVELGKVMAGQLLPALTADDVPDLAHFDPSTAALALRYRSLRGR